MSYRKFVFTVIGIILFVLSGIAVFNYTVDPFGVFRSDEKDIVNILVRKQNVANAIYNDRLLQKYFVEKNEQKYDVLLFGSSRSLVITKDFFPQQSFFNHSVNGATLEDILAIFSMDIDKKQFPRKVVLNLDPWILNKYHGLNRWWPLYEEYNRANAYLNLGNSEKSIYLYYSTLFHEKYSKLISLIYFKETFKKMLAGNKQDHYYATAAQDADAFIKRVDGSQGHPVAYRERAVDKVRESAIYDINNGRHLPFLDKFKQIDEKYRREFEFFVKYLQQQNIEVVFLLAPYHPMVYKHIIGHPSYIMIPKVEEYFRLFARQQGITVAGSYDPAKSKVTEADFYDGWHPKPQAFAKILETAVSGGE